MEIETLRATLAEIDTQLPTATLDALKVEMSDVEFQIKTYETQHRNFLGEKQSKQLEKEFQEKGIQSYLDQCEQLQKNNEAIEKEKLQYLEEIQLIEKQITGLEAQTGELDEAFAPSTTQRDEVQTRLIQEEQRKMIDESRVEPPGRTNLAHHGQQTESFSRNCCRKLGRLWRASGISAESSRQKIYLRRGNQ